MPGKLYLIPSLLAESEKEQVIPEQVTKVINSINNYIVENERTARRMLLKMGIRTSIDSLRFHLLNKHTQQAHINNYLQLFTEGDVGLLSEAGVPAVADPGSEIVAMAHQQGIEVVPLVGPSSILLAMMASGMNGQHFTFAGYLPVKKHERMQRIRFLESRSQKENQSQIFIETPYRNNSLLNDLMAACSPPTRVCIACELTSPNGWVITKTVKDWKKQLPDLHKKPAIFIMHK